MFSSLYRLGAWLLQKLATIVLILVLGLTAYGLWLFLQDNTDFNSSQAGRVAQLTAHKNDLMAKKEKLQARVIELQGDVSAQEDRLGRSKKVIENLRALDTWRNRIFGDREQRKANTEQMARMEVLRKESNSKLVDLRRALRRNWSELHRNEIELAPLERRLYAFEQNHSAVAYYLMEALEKTKWYLLAVVAWYFFGPLLVKFFLFYLVAPRVSRSRPIRLANEIGAMPRVGESRDTLAASLWPGEILRVKGRYLQTYDPGLERKKRSFLDWKLPLTSVACGLTDLVELRNTRAGADGRVVLSSLDDSGGELAVVHVPEGSSLILRPSYLAGVIQPDARKLDIRRRWTFFRWQSWVAFQFRFLEFAGPCRLVVAGRPSVRVENVVIQEGNTTPLRRAPQYATIGFTPNLDYQPLRSERFRNYLRGATRLFDDGFKGGAGFFLANATPQGTPRLRTWPSFRTRFFKILGI